MEIDGSSPSVGLRNGVRRLDAPKQTKIPSSNDTIYLVRERSGLSHWEFEAFHFNELIRSTPDIREERVTQVRGNLEEGTYNVIAARIAEKIIGGELPEVFF